MPEDEIVVYKRGEVVTPPPIPKRIPPELLQIIMLDDLRVAVGEVNRHLEKEEFQGVLVPKTLSATDKVKQMAPLGIWPYVPWISAYFINAGPDMARIAINEPSERFELGVNETVTVSRAHAEERIRAIFYVCDQGKTASIRVTGEY